MIDEKMTLTDLYAWSNSLGFCRFAVGDNEIVCSGKNGAITMRFGRFSKSLGGGRMIHFDVEDRRDCRPWDGMGYGSSELGEISSDIERYSTALGLYEGQMALF